MPEDKREKRTFSFAVGEERKMTGHAAIFNEEAQIGGWFREKIEAGAFKKSIKEDDIRALFNHDPNFVLGRNTSGTLSLKEDERGLKIDIDPPDTQFARDLAVSIGRGDISQMSFAFEALRIEWVRAEEQNGTDLRIIKEARLFDISPVTFPAYEGTDIAMRSHDTWKKETEEEEKKKLPTETDDDFQRNNKLMKLRQRRKL